MPLNKDLITAIFFYLKAGAEIMKVYNLTIEVVYKDDKSPLNLADIKTNTTINSFLVPTGIPTISEENKQK